MSRRYFFRLLHPEYLAFGSVSYEPCQTTNFFLFYFRWREGVPTSVLGSQPIVWLLPSPPWSGDFVRATRCHPSQVTEYRQVAPIYHHALTVILWGLATVNSNERIAVIPLPSSQWDITWHKVKTNSEMIQPAIIPFSHNQGFNNYTGTLAVLTCHILKISISLTSYLLILLFSLTDI